MRLVLIEDDVTLQLLTEARCNSELAGTQGFDGITATARTLQDATWILSVLSQQADAQDVVAVVDLHLPDSHGAETLRRLAAAFPDVHLIAHSCDDAALDQLRDDGITAITKLHPERLTGALSELLAREAS